VIIVSGGMLRWQSDGTPRSALSFRKRLAGGSVRANLCCLGEPSTDSASKEFVRLSC
jgi:hypothetical protein